MVNIVTDLTDGLRRLQKLSKDMSEIELREEILLLRELLTSARDEVMAKSATIAALEQEANDRRVGESCPICGTGRLKVVASSEHPDMPGIGVQERTLKCTNCNNTEKRIYDPEGILRTR